MALPMGLKRVSENSAKASMQQSHLSKMVNGWFVGNFSPSVFNTPHAEVGFRRHSIGEDWPAHYQRTAYEINLLIHGKMNLQTYHYRESHHIRTTHFEPGDLFVIYPEEVAKPEFLTDCELVVVKVPSLPSDKVLV